MLEDFLHLFFPSLCLGCNRLLYGAERFVCTHCLGTLRESELAISTTSLEEKMGVDVPIEQLHFLYKFEKGSPIQQLMYKLKYENKQGAAEAMGYYYGTVLGGELKGAKVDTIVPVPLHAAREAERGYNQSAAIAVGMGKALDVPCEVGWLIRKRATATQTNKTRQERWHNVLGAFEVDTGALIKGRNLLLVDDVLTTGATLRACAQAILRYKPRSIRIAVLAVAV